MRGGERKECAYPRPLLRGLEDEGWMKGESKAPAVANIQVLQLAAAACEGEHAVVCDSLTVVEVQERQRLAVERKGRHRAVPCSHAIKGGTRMMHGPWGGGGRGHVT